MLPQVSKVDSIFEDDIEMQNLTTNTPTSHREFVNKEVVTKKPKHNGKDTSHIKKDYTPEQCSYLCPKCKQVFEQRHELNDHVLDHLVAQVDAGVRQPEESVIIDVKVQEQKVKMAKRMYTDMPKYIEFTPLWVRWLERGDHQVCNSTNSCRA